MPQSVVTPTPASSHTIITIAREFGSGGHILGEMLAKDLGIKLYDKEFIHLVAQKSGIDESYIVRNEQSIPYFWLKCILAKSSEQSLERSLSSDDVLFVAESKIIQELAEKESCVIVGRCADFILQDRTDCLKVFVHADLKFRADRIVRVYGEREKSPESRLKEKDKRRAAYYRFYTDMNWGNAANYHIALDSGVIGIEKSAEIIESLS